MDTDMKTALEALGQELGLRNPTAFVQPEQTTSNLALRWRNDNDKNEQVTINPESIIERDGNITLEAVVAEVKRLIEASETEVLD